MCWINPAGYLVSVRKGYSPMSNGSVGLTAGIGLLGLSVMTKLFPNLKTKL